VKNIIVIAFLLFIFCQLQNAQVKSVTSEQIALMDLLLFEGNTATLDSCLLSDMPPACIAKENSITFPWDSVKSEYAALLQRLKRISTDEQPTTQNLTAIYEVNAERFQKRFACEYAESSFNKFRKQTVSGDTKEALKNYWIANYFREKYINSEKIRMLRNAYELPTMIASGRYEEALKLVQLYKDEDRQAPAFKIAGRSFKPWYDESIDDWYNRHAEDLKYKMYLQEVETPQSSFRKINYAIGVGLGASLLLEEPWPSIYTKPITEKTKYEGKDIPKSLFGYTVSINFSYYLNKDNIEFEYLYGKIERKHQPFIAENPYGGSIVFSGINLPITYSLISVIYNYKFIKSDIYNCLKTNIQPSIGLGINYALLKTSANGVFYDNNMVIDFYPCEYYQFKESTERTESIRLFVRPCVEYIPSEDSNFSYSLLCDISINLHSSASVATVCIFPRFRVSWLF